VGVVSALKWDRSYAKNDAGVGCSCWIYVVERGQKDA
jgi:hypothetical protein